MTAHFLSTELIAIIQESKKKNSDLRHAAEKSLNEIKALPQTSETQFAADLKNRPALIRPLFIACGTRNAKLAGSGISCLQRLIITKALPKDYLEDVLDGFRECSSLVLDIQLKVLQALPSLLQNYGDSLSGDLLGAAYEVCFLLYGSKPAVVSNTAAAVLQQLVTTTFEKLASEGVGRISDDHSLEVSAKDGVVSIHGAAADAYQVLNDICLMIEGQRPRFLTTGSLTQSFGLELIESVLTDYMKIITAHPELMEILRLRLMPLMLKILSEKVSFALTVRVMRLLQLIVSYMLLALTTECEVALGLLNGMLDPATNLWKRALALEVFRSIHANPDLVRSIYEHFDEKHDMKNIIRDHFDILVRLAAEKPAVIGLGSRLPASSRPPSDADERLVQATQGVAGSIPTTTSALEGEGVGLSTRWSMMKVPCIDLIDKAEPPSIPATYIYALALICINSFPDGLAKFLLPLAASADVKPKRKPRIPLENASSPVENLEDGAHRSQARQTTKPSATSRSLRPRKESINPLSLQDHDQYRHIRTSARMVEDCWPALLAVYSTFLNAALDTDYFHALIRSFQKFTQVAGLLDFSTPRDAFLTTLGKYSIPAGQTINNKLRKSLDHSSRKPINDERDGDVSPATILASPKTKISADQEPLTISSRNLLALRALLNIGIALGPSLEQSWSIVLETLQQAELLLPNSHSAGGRPLPSRQSSRTQTEQRSIENIADGEDFSLEFAAAETAAARLIESTSDFSDDAFLVFTQCLCNLFHPTLSGFDRSSADSPNNLLSPQTHPRKHQRFPSVADRAPDEQCQQENLFTLKKMHELIQCNVRRLSYAQGENSAWELLTRELKRILSTQTEYRSVRVSAAETFNDLLITTATYTGYGADDRGLARARAFGVIKGALEALYKEDPGDLRDSQSCNEEIHRLILETIRSILEQCGESMSLGWDTVFRTLMTIFDKSMVVGRICENDSSGVRRNSAKLIRSSFGSLQLICSDYLQFVPLAYFPMLIDTLCLFCSQSLDLNISLTTSTLFANVSSFLQNQDGALDFDDGLTACKSPVDLVRYIEEDSSKPSVSALWLLLTSRVENIMIDERPEVRRSVLHTLFRIFDNCSDELNAPSWRICFDLVLRPMLSSNQKSYESALESISASDRNHVLEEWNKTSADIVEGVAHLFAQNFATMRGGHGFSKMWDDLLDCWTLFLHRNLLSLSTAVFAGLTEILEEVDEIEAIGKPAIDKAWELWKGFNPVSHEADSQVKTGNQDATMAYLRCIPQVYRLMGADERNEHASSVIHELHLCVIHAEVPAYSNDVDRMTPVQKGIMENLKMIPFDQKEVQSRLIDFLATLVVLPYEGDKSELGKGSTFLALSKAAITSLQAYIIRHRTEASQTSCELITRALNALAVPIHLKYNWYTQSKKASTWTVATTAAVDVLESCVPVMTNVREPGNEVEAFWDQSIKIIDGIVAADCESCEDIVNIPKDQEFDIEAVRKILTLVIPSLGYPHIPDGIRRRCAEVIFEKSLIHEPHPDDLARPGQELLEGLKYDHIGRTQDLPPTPRSKMSYVLLDELLKLIAVHDGSADRIRLAQAAAPYLILRCGLTLKTYVYDQPLRGRMPQPWSQKGEMHHILRKLAELNIEPKAMPDVPDVISEHKKHLFKLYPLLTKALKAAFRDEEMTKALGGVLDVLGKNFGF